MNKLFTSFYFLLVFSVFPAWAQEQNSARNDSLSTNKNSHQHNEDPRYSVFGPPQPAYWKFQLSHMYSDNEGTFSFNFYRKDQRDRTIFFSIVNNGFENTNQYRVQQI